MSLHESSQPRPGPLPPLPPSAGRPAARGPRRPRPGASPGWRVERLESRLLLSAGDPDANFGNRGLARLSGFDVIDAAVEPSGGVVLLVRDPATGGPALTRFDPTGQLDGTFGNLPTFSGVVTDGLDPADTYNSVALQSNGDIVVGGTTGDHRLRVARYLPDGTLDRNGFGSGGIATVAAGTPGLFDATKLLVRPDDRLVLGADVDVASAGPTTTRIVVAALTAGGAPDSSFGGGTGVALTDISGNGASAGDFALLGDGRVVASAASDLNEGTPQIVLAVYTPAGAPDTTFNATGVLATTAVPTDASRHLAVGTDGIVLFSPNLSASQEAVARFRTDGTPDTSFGAGNGVVTLNIARPGGGAAASDGDVAVDATGRILVGFPADNGGGGGTDVVRLNADGSPDTTFGPVGTRAFTTAADDTRRLVFGPDKSLLTVGGESATAGAAPTVVLFRLDASRPPLPVLKGDVVTDTAANTLAVTVTYVGDVLIDATRVDTGDIRLTGPAGYDTNSVEVRDVTTGGNDVTATYVFPAPGGTLGVEDNGAYTVAANVGEVLDFHGNPAVTGAIATLRVAVGPPVLTIGGLDPTFGGTGLVSKALGFNGTAGVATQEDGKVVVAGFGGPAGNQDIGLARFNPNGTADVTFGGGDGIQFLDVRGTDDIVTDVKVLHDGQIVIVGSTSEVVDGQTVGSDFFIARFLGDGSPDPVFNGTGITITDFASDAAAKPSTDVARSVLVQADTAIVVAGRSDAGNGTGTDFALARYFDDGTPDFAFNNGSSTVLIDFAGGDDGTQGVAAGGKGAVVAAGYATQAGQRHVALVQLTHSGALDPKFGGGGKVVTTAGGTDERANAVATVAKGGIVVAGSSATGTAGSFSSDILVARYTSKGQPDAKFGGGGVARASFGQPAGATAVMVLSDGRIVASGVTGAAVAQGQSATLDLAVARFLTTGAPDPTFSDDGKAIIPTAAVSAGASLRTAGRLSPQAVGDVPPRTIDDFQNSSEGKLAGRQGGGAFLAGTDAGQTVVAAIVTGGVELSGVLESNLPTAVVGGAKGGASVSVSDVGDAAAGGVIDIQFFVSADQSLDSSDHGFFTLSGLPLSLKPLTFRGKPKVFRAKFTYPGDVPDGVYFVLAEVNATGSIPELNPENNTAFSDEAVRIAAPFVDLTGPALAGGAALKAGGTTPLPVTVTNNGNVPLQALVSVTVTLSANDTLGAGDTALAAVSVAVNLKPSAGRTIRVPVTVPAVTPGSYFVFVRLDVGGPVADKNTANNLLASALPSVVS